MNGNSIYFESIIAAFRERQRARPRLPLKRAAGAVHRRLRDAFVDRLACLLERHTTRVRRDGALIWFDEEGRLGNAQLLHCMPLAGPQIPFVLTISLNYLGSHESHADLTRLGWRGWPYWPEHSHRPSLAVTARPEEALLFVPWIAQLVEDPDRGLERDPPVRCSGIARGPAPQAQVWTVRALEEVEAYQRICGHDMVGGQA